MTGKELDEKPWIKLKQMLMSLTPHMSRGDSDTQFAWSAVQVLVADQVKEIGIKMTGKKLGEQCAFPTQDDPGMTKREAITALQMAAHRCVLGGSASDTLVDFALHDADALLDKLAWEWNTGKWSEKPQ